MMELPKRHAAATSLYEQPAQGAGYSGHPGRPWLSLTGHPSGSALMLATSSHCARLPVSAAPHSAALRALSRSGPLRGGDH